jgi:diadenosine tetraphosphate (Ap4A) HIT family hydrolase
VTRSPFILDERLAQDALFIADLALSRVMLMNDTRYPWLILVPRRAGVTELTDLTIGDQATLLAEINRAAAAIGKIAAFDKLNIGMLGNVVSQLHVHIVGRRHGDDAWPGPVWGRGEPPPYPTDAATRHVDALRRHLGDTRPPSPERSFAP